MKWFAALTLITLTSLTVFAVQDESTYVTNNRQQCIDFAFEIYNRTSDTSKSMDLAVSLCQQVEDTVVLKLFYEWFYQNHNSTAALDMAAKYGGFYAVGKYKVALFMFSIYNKNHNTDDSAHRAGEQMLKVPPHSEGCLERYFEIYNRNEMTDVAMDKAVEACRY